MSSFSPDKILCRLFACWFSLAAALLVYHDGYTSVGFAQDVSTLTLVLFFVGFFTLYSAASLFVRGKYRTDTWALLLAFLVCAVIWCIRGAENDGFGAMTEPYFLFSLALILSVGLILSYVVQKNESLIQRIRPSKRTVSITVLVCVSVSFLVIALIGCFRYWSYSAPNFDFGLFCNMFHYLRDTGLPLVTSERDVLLSHFAVHLSPIFYVLLPFYALIPSPLTLQIGQAAIIASGILPVLLLCREKKLSPKTTIAFCVIYAAFPALTGGCFYDLHENCFLAPLLLWMFLCFEKKKYLPMYLFAAAVLMVKEDAAVYVAVFALYVLFGRKEKRHGLILFAAAIAWFTAALAILSHYSTSQAELFKSLGETPNPAIAGPMVSRYANLCDDPSDGLLGVIKTALINPGFLLRSMFIAYEGGWDKVIYFAELILPLGFLPFCTKKPSRWLLAAPLLINLLTGTAGGRYQYSIVFQYSFGIAAFLVYASILNIRSLSQTTRRTLLVIGVVSCLSFYAATAVPKLASTMSRWIENREAYRQMDEVLEKLPEDASVCASTTLIAHLADRDRIYQIDYHGDAADVDYVVIDVTYGGDDHTRAYLRAGYQESERSGDRIIILEKTK